MTRRRRAATVEFIDGGSCLAYDATGRLLSQFDTDYSFAYNELIGAPLSADGRLLFVSSWERGVSCYDVCSGERIWREGPGRARKLFVVDDRLVVEMVSRGIYVRFCSSGKLVKLVTMTTMQCMFRPHPSRLFVGPKRNQYYLLGLPELEVRRKIKANVINKNECLSFVITGCKLVDDSTLRVGGFESYPHGVYGDSKTKNFSRKVSIQSAV